MTEAEWLDIFSKNLIEIMRDVGITQRELADETGLSEASISCYIRKIKMPGVRALVNIAYALDCSLNELMDFGDRIT